MVYGMKRTSRFLALLLTLVMVFTVCGTGVLAQSADADGAAAAGADVPDPSANFYIHDEEGLLSDETKNAILSRNAGLYESYGIQIVVLSLAKIPGADLGAKGAYLHQIIDSWQIGGTTEKCLVLMLSKTENNYVAVAGNGLDAAFKVDTWSELFAQHLEPDFAVGQYDAGALKLFNAMADKAELYAVQNGITAAGTVAVPTAEPTAVPEEEQETEKPGVLATILRVFGIVVFAVLVILIVGFIVIYVHGQQVKKKRREARRRKAMQARAQQNDNRRSVQNSKEDYNDFMNRY